MREGRHRRKLQEAVGKLDQETRVQGEILVFGPFALVWIKACEAPDWFAPAERRVIKKVSGGMAVLIDF
jgi:hypothetical protein